METSNIVDNKTATTASRKLNIDLLKIIHAARQTYGLRTNDYSRYHAHCVRRVNTLHRATKTLNKPSSSSSKKNATSSTAAAAASTSKGKKKNAKTGSKNNTFTSTTSQITSDAVLKDERLLELLVWEAERSWSEGMKQREEIAALERSNNNNAPQALASKRHRAIKRFHRACQHAEALSTIAKALYSAPSDPLTASSAFQIELYYQYMLGTFAFVKVSSPRGAISTETATSISPASALKSLSTAYVLLESYGQASQRATEEAIAFELLDELEPLIRFCAYKAGTHSSQPPAEIAKDAGKESVSELEKQDRYPNILNRYSKEQSIFNKKKSRKDIGTVHQLTWRDIDIPVRSAELADTLGRVQKAIDDVASRQSRLSSRSKTSHKATSVSSAVYDRSLAVLIEAEDKARKLVEDNATALARAHSARFEAAAKPLTTVHSYISFHLLSIRTQRDEALMQETKKTLARREAKVISQNSLYGPVSMRVKRRRMKLYPIIIKLLDSMAQSYEKMRQLAVVEEDSTDLAEEVDALLAYSKARRCLYLGETYAMLDKYAEAITLLQRGALYLRQARSASDTLSSEPAFGTEDRASGRAIGCPTADDFNQLQMALEQAESRSRKDWYIHTVQPEGEIEDPASIDVAVKNMTLRSTSPSKRNIKRKRAGPLFFDVAFSYIAPVGTEMSVDSQGSVLDSVNGNVAAVEGLASASKELASPAINKDEGDRAQQPTEADNAASSTSGRGLWGFFGRRK
ncbi:hypothetical protein P389DRAFT_192574 [Cystobasidium minutum MCA 4210]|uniref:uncharacterized protein n=1 Tax=Cystobasidium minutum MCA 4210 TaxID=1397322 RepID=UPI0034CE6909|eukprot:jgi/Rhomi1/192574/gm1.788_g